MMGVRELQKLAKCLVATGEGREAFARALAECEKSGTLRELAHEYTPHDEVSVPVYRRLRELLPDDAQLVAELGFVFWLCGENDLAEDEAESVRALDPSNVQGLLRALAFIDIWTRWKQ